MVERFSVINIVDEFLLKRGVKLSVICVCLFSNSCCQRNVYTHSHHSHCFKHSLWGVKMLPQNVDFDLEKHVWFFPGGPRCYR